MHKQRLVISYGNIYWFGRYIGYVGTEMLCIHSGKQNDKAYDFLLNHGYTMKRLDY